MSSQASHLEQNVVTEPLHVVAEQFEDAGQQREAATLGMWGFLATEVLFFGGLFVAYSVYRIRWPEQFRDGSLDLKWYLGAINTAVLLFSSFFMAMAVHAAQQGRNRDIVRHLLVTIALALVFLGIKATEYYLEFDEGLVPGRWFERTEPRPTTESAVTRAFNRVDHWVTPAEPKHERGPQEELFMCFYFIMTAIHATHMVIGIGLMSWLIWMTRRQRFSAEWHTPVEVIGLYWHFVDTVWVFLFPILYLLRNP